MLIEFTVGNFLSFKEKKTLSLEAAAITEFQHNVVEQAGYKILRSAVIYGANSSGKSNFINALINMYEIVKDSAKKGSTDKIKVVPFLLSTATENQPSHFEVLFLIEGIRYRYGFEVDDSKVYSEWLFQCIKDNEEELFVRVGDDIDISTSFPGGIGLEMRTRSNALFLSVADQFNVEIATTILKWFGEHNIVSGIKHENSRYMSLSFISDPNYREHLTYFLEEFNLGFGHIKFEGDQENSKDGTMVTYHKKYDENNNHIDDVEFSLISQESSGTNKLFDLSVHIWFGLFLGEVVVIDELDAKLHPLITQKIVKLFNDPKTNPNNGQLIFATHDTNLLTHGGFRRDQIYFAEKDQFEASDLYSLVEYKLEDQKKVRKDRSFEKDYIQGRYGAIPFLGNFSELVKNG
ncbi:AAA family ATPase [Pedobacter sp. GR22-10]|uniref:AAA family ATPase n=1 Tax=Pedobacter sp. GR22-10 TaxID=2994472 RepID=UPI00224665EC|nr:ATP-binding protein [Pedobacter sp. GR22-10]MCX2429617.1 ATP-binding protein [Pedobacter sp. GR22-10]